MGYWRLFKTSLSLDYRSLALYRILIGIMVMADVFYRIPDFTNFYTDAGLVPRSIFVSEMTMPWSFSLHLANGSLGFIVAMFVLHAIFGAMVVLGHKTRWAMFGAWIMTVSVHNRNWLVNNGGDDVLRAILFISIFLPLSRCLSVDSALTEGKRPADEDRHFSSWGLTFLLQVFVIYFVSYILKDHPIWKSDFTAIFYSSRLDIFATPLALWMRDFPNLQKFFTLFTIYLEWLGPLLLVFSSVFGKRWWMVRLLVVLLFWGLHVGILFTMWIGIFPLICISMWAALIPGEFWDRILGKLRARGLGKLAIYYDGDCGFCKKGVYLLKEFFLFREVNVAPAQGNAELEALMLKQNSWIVVNGSGERFFHFEAFLELLRHSPVLRGLEKLLFPFRGFFHGVYVWVANHRSGFSHLTQFLQLRSPKKELPWARWIWQGTGAFLFVTLLLWNITTIKKFQVKAPFFQNVTRWLHLYQEWNMFAPFPKLDNLWVEIPAVLGNGEEIELITGDRDVYSVKDQRFYKMVPNEHWRKFYLNLSGRNDYARYYGSFLCRQWNERKIRWVPETTLRKMEIVVFSQMNLPDGGKGGITRKSSWKHWCFDEDYKREGPGASGQ